MQNSTKNENMINEDNWESSTNWDMRKKLMNDQKYSVRPPYEKDRKIEKCQRINFDSYSKKIKCTSV